MAKQQGREMVNEARAYRERVLSELARRRELAREQIEQLIHGRDRLMQSFERARLVAVDVVAELQPLGEPDEYVDLTPTTGPVPVMVPNQRAESDASAEVGSEEPGRRRRRAGGRPPSRTPMPRPTQRRTRRSRWTPRSSRTAWSTRTWRSWRTRLPRRARRTRRALEPPDDTAESPDDDTAETLDDDVTVSVETGAEQSDAEGDTDDVVVDLFARLRASTEGADPEATDVSESPDGGTEPAEPETGSAGDEPDVADEPTVFAKREADLTPLIVASARKLKRVLADEQNEVLDALRRSESVRHVDALLPRSNEHAGRYREAIADELVQAAQAESGVDPRLEGQAHQAAQGRRDQGVHRRTRGPRGLAGHPAARPPRAGA